MNNFVEHLESRRLFAVVYPGSGTFNGTFVPKDHTAALTIENATGSKKGAGKVTATLVMNIAQNAVITGTLALTGVATYDLSGMSVGVDTSIRLDLNGMGVGTFGGELKAFNKKLIGSITDTVGGTVIQGKLNLINSAAVKTKKGAKNNQSVALAPGYYPNETPPPITSGIGAGTSAGSSTGLTGGDNSGTGTIDSGGGSLLG